MANKILNIESSTKKITNNEVYVDIDMVSSPSVVHYRSGEKTPYNEKINKELSKRIPFKVQKIINVYSVYNSLKNIFQWIPGERVILPEFGSKLRLYLYEGITKENQEKILVEINQCVSKWEPRAYIVKIINGTTTEDKENNTVRCDVIFKIPTLSDEQYRYSFEHSMNN